MLNTFLTLLLNYEITSKILHYNYDLIVDGAAIAVSIVAIIVTIWFSKRTNGILEDFRKEIKGIKSIEENLKEKVGEIGEEISEIKEVEERLNQKVDEIGEEIESIKKLDSSLSKKINTIADATREMLEKLPATFRELNEFLEKAKNYDKFYVLTDTVALCQIHKYNENLIEDYNEFDDRDLNDEVDLILQNFTNVTNEKGGFYLTHLSTTKNEDNESALTRSFLNGTIKTIAQKEDANEIVNNMLKKHQLNYSVIEDNRVGKSFSKYGVEQIPFQLFLTVHEKKENKNKRYYNGLVIFSGTYNLEYINEVRSLSSTDSQLIKTFISMWESISGHDEKKNTLTNKIR